ncbi:hypothetical protein N752_13285 [Desulforamulus aquiferis]|nr:hypothetical protein N752_13285 [Desulforamulus aquiferis]
MFFKGKLSERRGRKTTGLKEKSDGGRVALGNQAHDLS